MNTAPKIKNPLWEHATQPTWKEQTGAQRPDLSGKLSLADWMGEALAAAFDVSLTSLGKENYRVVGPVERYDPKNMAGAYVPMISREDAVIIGLLTNKTGCQELAKYFLQTENRQSALSKEDAADAVRELLNILCGVMKRQMVERHPIVKTGLPVFVEGDVTLATGQESLCMQVKIGSVDIYVRLILSSAAAPQLLLDQLQKPAKRMSLDEWLAEIANAVFAMTPVTIGTVDNLIINDMVGNYAHDGVCGAYMPLIGESEAVLIGLISDPEGFEAVARTFIGVEREFQLTGEDTADAVKEMLNILSGLIRRQLAERQLPFHMGLPIFIKGYIETGEEQEAACVMARIRKANLHLVVIRKNEGTSAPQGR